MKSKEKIVYVYENFSSKEPLLLGHLYFDCQRGQEITSFEFNEEWLATKGKIFELDPELLAFRGRQYPTGKETFGLFADASPDRWGRMLMNKRERLLADREGRKPHKLHSIDYMLGVDDETRLGALRFKLKKDGTFVNNDKNTPIPPWTSLRTLEEMSRNIENDEIIKCEAWIEQLIKPGSSLGGARPKTTTIDTNGELWIAKFPSKNDEINSGAWEMVAHELAVKCGLAVPKARLEKFSGAGSTFLVKRFDREQDRRIHIASAMTMLGRTDGDSAAEGISYLDIVDFIKGFGSETKKDLHELWKRIVFSMSITNTDDHLRNHAFILTKTGWKLSPMFDINPVPYGKELSLNVDKDDNAISLDLAISVSPLFGIPADEARCIADKMLDTIHSSWEELAKKCNIPAAQIREMAPAFKLCE